MDPVTIGFIASTAISVGSQIFGGMAANKAAEKAAAEQAKNTMAQRTEQIRQNTLVGEQNLGNARARAYASNLQPTGSTGRYLSAIDTENQRTKSYAVYAAKREREAILESGQGAGNSLFYSAAGDALGAAAMGFASQMKPADPGQGVSVGTRKTFGS